MPLAFRRWLPLAPLLLLACRSSSAAAPGPVGPADSAAVPPAPPLPEAADTGLPEVPATTGALRLRVTYPRPEERIDARDSSFLFGSTGTGEATLTLNGQPVPVAPNGAWLAWVALPPDSVLTFRLEARTPTDSASYLHTVRRAPRFSPPPSPVWIDSTSFSPSRHAWWPAGEPLPVSLRASEGATVRLLLPDGTRVSLTADRSPEEVPWGIRAFDRDTANLAAPTRADRYLGTLRARTLGPSLGPVVGMPDTGVPLPGCCRTGEPPGRRAPAEAPVIVEAILGPDTARASWPLQLTLLDSTPRLVEFNDDTASLGTSDSLTVGRARPGATYHWFFPTGTRTVATGRLGDDLRVRLSSGQDAWVPAGDALPLAAGLPAVRATIGSITLTPGPGLLSLRIPAGSRVPFRVEEEAGRLTLRLYSAVGDVNWIRYGAADPYIRDIRWQQATTDEVTITVDLTAPVWGYRTRWVRNDLLLEIRRPPVIDSLRPLAGRFILVDAGHPPLGATGPTGFREAEANLAVALTLRDLLEAAGARVAMTRTRDEPLELWPRVRLADSIGAEVLVSIHNNALPDGVNPFTNSGSSVFYNHPRSRPLAEAIQRQFVRRLGLRDLGVGRGDLALVRPTWMPAVLTEGLFMMIPEQEAALRHPDGQRRYALAVRDGLAAWLRGVARSTPVVP